MKFLTIACTAVALSALASETGEAQTSLSTDGASPGVQRACATDAAKWCSGFQQNRTQCMDDHQNVLSDGCTDGGLESIAGQIASRSFPSIFEAWNAAENLHRETGGPTVSLLSTETVEANMTRHDLYFGWRKFGLQLAGNRKYPVLSPEFTPESIKVALRNRAALRAANPNMLILAETHYYSAGADFLPPDSPWWRRGASGERTEFLDFSDPVFQDKVAALCDAQVKTGVFDGCMFDWWHDDVWPEARVALIKKTRAAVGEKAILLGNVNASLPVLTAPYLNGMFMEGFGSRYFPDWRKAAANLLWGESHLRKPAITALEGWYACEPTDCHGDTAEIQRRGRAHDALMREVTTLSLVFSNGYVLFSDPNALPTPDHLHDWYPFWDKSLGRPAGPLAVLERPDLSGAYTRKFDNGEAVFNPPSNHPVTVRFDQPRRSAETGATGQSFTIAPGDGDLFLFERHAKDAQPAD